MKTAGLLCLCAMLAGCLPTAMTFTRGDVPEKQFTKDDYECERDARMLPNTTSCQQMRFYETCMKSKAYSPKPGSGSTWAC